MRSETGTVIYQSLDVPLGHNPAEGSSSAQYVPSTCDTTLSTNLM